MSRPEPVDDGLVIPDVGPWSRDKHHFLGRYIDAFTTAMRCHWGQLHYIDLFSGAGMERVRSGGLEWGSPLLAATTKHRFAQLHLCELDQEKASALKERIRRYPQPREPQIFCEDANEHVALVGVSNLVVVRTADRTLVVPRERAEEIKKLVQHLDPDLR